MYLSLRLSKKYWPKPSTLIQWRQRVSSEVGFTGENVDPNSVNYLDQNLVQSRTYRTAINDVDAARATDIDMPVRMNPRKLDYLKRSGKKERCVACHIPVSWKNVQFLSQFVSPWSGRMYERGVTNLCDNCYHTVRHAYKRAIDNGLLGRNYKQTAFMTDPNLSTFDYPNLQTGTDTPLPKPSYQRERVDAYLEAVQNTTGENAQAQGSAISAMGSQDTHTAKASPGEGQFFLGKSKGSADKAKARHSEMQSELAVKRAERKAKRIEEAKTNKEKNGPQVVIKEN